MSDESPDDRCVCGHARAVHNSAGCMAEDGALGVRICFGCPGFRLEPRRSPMKTTYFLHGPTVIGCVSPVISPPPSTGEVRYRAVVTIRRGSNEIQIGKVLHDTREAAIREVKAMIWDEWRFEPTEAGDEYIPVGRL